MAKKSVVSSLPKSWYAGRPEAQKQAEKAREFKESKQALGAFGGIEGTGKKGTISQQTKAVETLKIQRGGYSSRLQKEIGRLTRQTKQPYSQLISQAYGRYIPYEGGYLDTQNKQSISEQEMKRRIEENIQTQSKTYYSKAKEGDKIGIDGSNNIPNNNRGTYSPWMYLIKPVGVDTFSLLYNNYNKISKNKEKVYTIFKEVNRKVWNDIKSKFNFIINKFTPMSKEYTEPFNEFLEKSYDLHNLTGQNRNSQTLIREMWKNKDEEITKKQRELSEKTFNEMQGTTGMKMTKEWSDKWKNKIDVEDMKFMGTEEEFKQYSKEYDDIKKIEKENI